MVTAGRAIADRVDLIGRWIAVLEEGNFRPRILELADRYPEERSLDLPFSAVEGTDTGLADLLLERPEEAIAAGIRAMRELIPAAGPETENLRLRVVGLPATARRLIRMIRESDLNRFIALDGIVRKATEVRPQIREAVFSCLACRAEIREPQEDGTTVFREPLECPTSQGGCGKPAGRTRFRLLPEKSTYVDSQRIEVQENPETLKGGAHPQGLSVLLTEDLTGRVIPGNRVVVNGILKSQQRATPSRSGMIRSTTFDLSLLGNSLEYKQREYDEIEISEEEERLILAFKDDPTVVDKVVLSLAPTIKGMEEEKEAIALQMFGGVEKKHADGVRVRGDIHCLIVGDPGCLIGDERVSLGDGTVRRLDRFGQAHLQPISTQVRLGAGGGKTGRATRFHRYRNQPILEVVTESGKCIKGTPNHPLYASRTLAGDSGWRRLDELRVGDQLAVARSIRCWKRSPVPTGWKEPNYYHKSWHVRVPEVVDEDLAAILGYVLGDGSVTPRRVHLFFGVAEADVATRISALFERVFGVRPKVGGLRHGEVNLDVNRTAVAQWLWHLRTHRVPQTIFGSPNRVVASFLRWLFQADGSCFAKGRGANAISLRSAHIELLRDVQTLLLRWGIHSRILWTGPPRPHVVRGRMVRGGPSGSLMIRRAESQLKFAEAIGFVGFLKQVRLNQLKAEASSPRRRRHGQNSERIVSIRRAGRATVYDIEVPGSHRFLANGVVSHNTAKSQLLRYIADVAPRGIYTSGKGATAAGLTAAAVKDDFGGGRWMLEAGMLVLADGGMAIVDELDKMTPEDRSAMHEALEQQTVSIAKAGITATLNARCPVLAAANPKWGRFNPDKGIAEQLDLPPTLLSRFDVIYSIKDKPEEKRDRFLANRILQSHKTEGEARAITAAGGTAPADQGAPFAPDLLRKYIAYARRNVRPVLTDEALRIIEDFYVRVRKQGEEPDAPVPITARQLEALVRLSEAAARARLSPRVGAQDAERATRIVEGFLERVTTADGKMDIDAIATGVTHTQRERAELLQELMRELQEAGGGTFDLAILKTEAERRGIPPNRVEALFSMLRNQGEIAETRPGRWQLIRF